MARTVTVSLKAEVGQFKKSVGEAERAADKLGDAIDDVGDNAKKSSRELDDMGAHAAKLSAQIRTTETGIRSLAAAFAATGDAKIVKQIREQQKVLRELRTVQKLLPEPAAIRTGLTANIKSALQGASPQALGIAGLGASLTPMLGGLIASAVIGGAGVGGIAGGIALAAKDPLIANRAKRLGQTVSRGLQVEAQQAFGQPLLAALDKLEQVAVRSIPKIGQAFDGVAPELDYLVDSLSQATDGLTDGLTDSAKNSGPVLRALGDLIADTGTAAGQILSGISDNSEGAAAAVGDLSQAIQDVIYLLGGAIEVFTTIRGLIADVEGWVDQFEWLSAAVTGFKDALMGPLGPLLRMYTETKKVEQAAKDLAASQEQAAKAADSLYASEDRLKDAQKESTLAQQEYTAALDQINPAASRAKRLIDGLKQATESLYGAQMQAVEANEAYEASWDNLSDSVKTNKGSLDIHTKAGRENRDALEDLLTKSQDLYLADIAAGQATDKAAAKHRDRTDAVKEEAKRLGLNKKITGELIETYGRIPPKRTTDLVVEGVNTVADRLFELSVMQYALAKGIPIQSARALLNGQNKRGPDKRNGGYSSGGKLPGPPSDVDNLTGVGPDGREFGLAGGEWIINARQSAKHHETLKAINEGRDGYADGGYFPPTDTSTRWPFAVTADRAYVMSAAQARKNVVPEGPSGGGASAPWIVATIKRTRPDIDIVSVFRKGARTLSGNLSLHAQNRAVDTEPDRSLAGYFYNNFKAKLREHITPWQEYNVLRGRSHTYTGAVWNQHNFAGGNAHNHIAMANGGIIGEPVLGVGASGRTYSFGEVGPERVTPMRGYASGGLVNVAPRGGGSAGGGSRLDYLDALLSARDAVASLTQSLKDNGKAWSVSTQKGRDNRQALIGGVRAAQQAAEAKYAESGSIKAANRVYDDYIRQLDRSMKAMGVNAKTRRELLKAYGERPKFEGVGGAPSNSSARVRSVTDFMAAEEAVANARNAFAWQKPTFSGRTEVGRAELQTLFGFLAAAEAVAQASYAETGNAKAATAVYNSYLNQLRGILAASGMKKAEIDRLFRDYGRITLSANRWGGVYERAGGGLREAQIAPGGGPTRYAWAEPATGGEAFIPRRGDKARSTAIWQHVGQQWLGQPVGGGRSGPITIEATIPITLGSEVITRQVRLEVDAAVGQVVAATVYQTA